MPELWEGKRACNRSLSCRLAIHSNGETQLPGMRKKSLNETEYKNRRNYPRINLMSRLRLGVVKRATQQPNTGPSIPPQWRVFQHFAKTGKGQGRKRAVHAWYADLDPRSRAPPAVMRLRQH